MQKCEKTTMYYANSTQYVFLLLLLATFTSMKQKCAFFLVAVDLCTAYLLLGSGRSVHRIPSSWYAIDLCSTLVHKHEMKHTFLLVCNRSTCTCHFCEMNTSPPVCSRSVCCGYVHKPEAGVSHSNEWCQGLCSLRLGTISQTRETIMCVLLGMHKRLWTLNFELCDVLELWRQYFDKN